LNDTWEWDGQNWTQQQDTGPNRCGHAMAYDDNRKRLVLFGGNDAANPQYGDTWEWDGATWTQRSDFGPPAVASGASLVFSGAVCVLFGGMNSGAPQKQTWSWDGSYWTARQGIGPSARSGHAAAYDSVRQCVVLFGGGGGAQALSPLGDTWEQNANAAPALALAGFTMTTLNEGGVGEGNITGQASYQLSGPAPAGGAVINLTVLDATLLLTSGMQTTIPAGAPAMQIPVALSAVNAPATATFTATLLNGNSLQASAPIVQLP
jgi:hypothetical protein